MRAPKYGELASPKNQEAFKIWSSRNVEPDGCEPFGWSHEYIDDGSRAEEFEIAGKLWEMLDAIPHREKKVVVLRLSGLTLDEVAKVLEVTRERIRQIEGRAIRKLKHHARAGSLPEPYPPWFGCWNNKPFQHPGFAWDEWAL